MPRQTCTRSAQKSLSMNLNHYMTQPLAELYKGCMVVLKVPWCGITAVRVDEVRQRELVVVHPGRGHLGL